MRTKLLYPALACCIGVAGCTHAHHQSSRTTNSTLPESYTSPLSPSVSININNASEEELATLPGIGKSFAARIIEHRERYGRFRRVEHLILVRGISERRFRELRPYITIE